MCYQECSRTQPQQVSAQMQWTKAYPDKKKAKKKTDSTQAKNKNHKQ